MEDPGTLMWSFLYVSELWMLLRGCAQAEVRWTRACPLCEGFAAGTKEHQAASSESQILQFDCGSRLRTKPALCLPWMIHSLNHGVDLSWDDPGSRSSQGWGRSPQMSFQRLVVVLRTGLPLTLGGPWAGMKAEAFPQLLS